MFRNGHRAEVVARPRNFLIAILEGRVGVVGFLPINVDAFMANLDRIPSYSDHPFDEILTTVAGINEDNHVSPLRVSPLPYSRFQRIGQPQAIEEFTDENVVADL